MSCFWVSVLVQCFSSSFVGPFRSFLYFGILLTETAATSERLAPRVALERSRLLPLAAGRFRCHFAGHRWKENELPSLAGRSLFLYVRVAPFSCQRPLGVSAYFNNFLFLIQFKRFYLFIYSIQSNFLL